MDNIALEATQGFQPPRSTWDYQLEASQDVHDILSIARDYLATFGPEHLARLPPECRPGRIKGEDDIVYWSCRLAQYRHRDPVVRIDADLLQDMLRFFLHAWVRVSQVQGTPSTLERLH